MAPWPPPPTYPSLRSRRAWAQLVHTPLSPDPARLCPMENQSQHREFIDILLFILLKLLYLSVDTVPFTTTDLKMKMKLSFLKVRATKYRVSKKIVPCWVLHLKQVTIYFGTPCIKFILNIVPKIIIIFKGDIVYVMEKCDDGWFVGTSQRTGIFGTFPGNYVTHV